MCIVNLKAIDKSFFLLGVGSGVCVCVCYVNEYVWVHLPTCDVWKPEVSFFVTIYPFRFSFSVYVCFCACVCVCVWVSVCLSVISLSLWLCVCLSLSLIATPHTHTHHEKGSLTEPRVWLASSWVPGIHCHLLHCFWDLSYHGLERMKNWQTHRNTYCKAGIPWAVLALMENQQKVPQKLNMFPLYIWIKGLVCTQLDEKAGPWHSAEQEEV